MSFFFSAYYTEGLFLLLTLATAYFASAARWPSSAVAAGFSAATKLMGALSGVLVAIEIYRSVRAGRGGWWIWSWVVLSMGGLVAYVVFLDQSFSDPWAFARAARHWGREAAFPWVALASLTQVDVPHALLFGAAVAMGAVLCATLWTRGVRTAYATYATLFFVASLCTSTLEAIPRHLSAIFPLYLSAGLLLQSSGVVRRVVLSSSAALSTVMAALFVAGYWIT